MKQLNNIDDLIDLIETNQINDLTTINELCKAMLNLQFVPIQIGDNKKAVTYYIKWLKHHKHRISINGITPAFLDIDKDFNIKQFYNPNE